MDIEGKMSDSSSNRRIESARRSPLFTPNRIFSTYLESIKKDKEKELMGTPKLGAFQRPSPNFQDKLGSASKTIPIIITKKSPFWAGKMAVDNNTEHGDIEGECKECLITEHDYHPSQSFSPDVVKQPISEAANKLSVDFNSSSDGSKESLLSSDDCSSEGNVRGPRRIFPELTSLDKSHSKKETRSKHGLKLEKKQSSPNSSRRSKRSDKESSKKGSRPHRIFLLEDKKSPSPKIHCDTPRQTNHDSSACAQIESASKGRWFISSLPEDTVEHQSAQDSSCHNAPQHISNETSLPNQTPENSTHRLLVSFDNSSSELKEEKTTSCIYGSLCNSELGSSSSSLLSSSSDATSSSQPAMADSSQWPFSFSPAYFANTPPPPIQSRPSFNHFDRFGSPASTPTLNQEKKFHCLQNLHVPPKPDFHGFQLIGDSMLLRFSQQILGEPPIISDSLRFLGYCVSGQRIGELLKRLKNGFYHLGKKVVLMIGTNDLLKQTKVEQMCQELRRIVEHLKEYSDQVVILTLPPVPRLQNCTDHWRRLDEYNKYIKKLSITDSVVSVSDLFPMYICSEEEVEERETTNEYYSNSLFCCGCFLCANDADDFDLEDLEERIDPTSYIHTISWSNSCVSISDISPLFMERRIPKCRMECFELFFLDARKDMIHLNHKGLQIVDEHLRKHLPLP